MRRFILVLALPLLWLNTAIFAKHTAAEVPPIPGTGPWAGTRSRPVAGSDPDRPITLAEASLFIARAKALSIGGDDVVLPSKEEQHGLPDSPLSSYQVDRMLLLAWPAPILVE